jgi:hypothetical protein
MKRALALKALDDATSEHMGKILYNCIFQMNARDQKALDEFSNGFGTLVKAYDAATKIITDKLVE